MRKLKLLSLLLLPVLVSCETNISTSHSANSNSSENISSSNNNSSSNNGNSDESSNSPIEDEYVEQTFGYQFEGGDFTTDPSTFSANGLTFSTTSATYVSGTRFDADNNEGMQIGSSKKPQTSPWILSTSFQDEIIITSYKIKLDTGSNGAATYKLSLDNHTKSGDFNQNPSVYGEENLDESTTSLSLELTAESKAMYIDYLYFTALVPTDSDLQLIDTINGTGPIDPEPDPDPNPDPDPEPEPDPDPDEPPVNPDGGIRPGEGDVPDTEYSPITSEEYYKNIDFSLSGTELENELYALVSDYTRYSYGDARYILLYTDQDIENPDYLYGLYDGDLIEEKWSSNSLLWNREHVWPCSRMEINGVSDISNGSVNHMTDLHNLRVSNYDINSYRSNKYFSTSNSDKTFYPNQSSDPNDDFTGDVARILFYMELVNPGLNLVNNPSDNGHEMGDLSLLLKWAKEDPVDEFERQRNSRIYEYQGNRNPFIDHPEIIDKLYA